MSLLFIILHFGVLLSLFRYNYWVVFNPTNKQKQFMDEIADWVKKVGFFKVVLLCGVIACERTDQQLSG